LQLHFHPGRGLGRSGNEGQWRGDGSGNGPLRLDGSIQKPVRIFATQVIYTEEARRNGIQGVVVLEAVINQMGHVEDVRVSLGQPHGLTENAVEAVRQWKYEPATQGGKPVAVIMSVTITFQQH